MKRLALLFLGVIVFALLLAPAAFAATPQDIYDDFADNGKLDKTYTDAELRAYLNDATLHQYGSTDIIDRLDDLVSSLLAREEFPFTGFQMLLAGIVAVVLVGGGLFLRRASRQT